jgi:hypothetical protein
LKTPAATVVQTKAKSTDISTLPVATNRSTANLAISKRTEHTMTNLYPIMKGKAYRLAQSIIAPREQGEDLLATIMSEAIIRAKLHS